MICAERNSEANDEKGKADSVVEPTMKIFRFLIRRLLLIAPLLLIILFLTFMLVRIGDRDPVHMLVGPTATQAEIELVRAQLGLDRPLFEQFYLFVVQLLQGDLGNSWLTGSPVLQDLLARAPATIELIVWGVGLGTVIGVAVGLRAAARPNGAFDQTVRFTSLFGFSIPTYWLGLMMMFIFFYLLGWAPPGMGRISMIITPPPRITGSYMIDALLTGDLAAAQSAFAQLVLPVLCIAIVASAPIIKQVRAIAMEVMSSDALRYVRASGLPPRMEQRVLLRNCATPLITFTATEITSIVGTTALIEYVFAWGGLGQYGLSAIISGDFAAVQGYVLALTVFSVVLLFLADLLILIIDPRANEV